MNSRRSLLVLVLLLTPASASAADTISVEWAVRAGGPKADKARGMALDKNGNVYLTGEFGETADFGEFKLTSRGGLDYFLAKYDPTGKCLWVRQGGGGKTDRGYAVAVDRDGNAYVTGHYESTDADFDGVKLSNAGDYDAFVAKYDSAGKLLWARRAGGAGYDYGHGVAVDGKGSAYVGVSVVGDATFGDTADKEPGKASRAVVACYAPDGALRWLARPRGKGSSSCGSIAADEAGNTWLCGGYGGEQEFGPGVGLKAATGRGAFVAKFDPAGKALWAAGTDGRADGAATSVGVDGKGRCYVAGMFKGTVAGIGDTTFTSEDNYDIFVAAFDGGGKPLWVRHAGGKGIDYALGLAADPAGGCYVVGEISTTCDFGDGVKLTSTPPGRDLYVARYTADGKVGPVLGAGAEREDMGYCIALDPKRDALYASGAFNVSTRYGATELKAAGSNDIMLIRLKR
ncbi:MAG: SBBP repeat-containing protein [Planctomycetes bacterium]|nr:SBBP repeat-containing protein [Planctomycetota bacterium]